MRNVGERCKISGFLADLVGFYNRMKSYQTFFRDFILWSFFISLSGPTEIILKLKVWQLGRKGLVAPVLQGQRLPLFRFPWKKCLLHGFNLTSRPISRKKHYEPLSLKCNYSEQKSRMSLPSKNQGKIIINCISLLCQSRQSHGVVGGCQSLTHPQIQQIEKRGNKWIKT